MSKSVCAKKKRCAAFIPDSDAQWILLALALTLLSALSLAPPAYLDRKIVFAAPSSADLLLPPRNPTRHLDRDYRTSVINRVAEVAPQYCAGRSALFAHNFIMEGGEGDSLVVDCHLVHFCSKDQNGAGETVVGLKFKPVGTAKVTCAEEYATTFAERIRFAQGMLEYAVVENGDYRRVRRATRSPEEACLVGHSLEMLNATWQDRSGI